MASSFMNRIGRIPPGVTLIVLVVGILGVGSAAFLMLRHGSASDGATAQANDLVPLAARMDKLDGDVGIARQVAGQDQSNPDWTTATVNAPVSIGDRIYAKDGSKAAIAFSGRKYVRLNPRTSLDVLSLNEHRTQLALRDGSCVFDVGALDSDDLFEVATPNGAVDLLEPGLYQVGIDDGGSTVVSCLRGEAQVAGLSGSGRLSKGQILTLAAASAAEAVTAALSHDLAGTIVNDYYSYRYPNSYDGRYTNYDVYLDDDYYYDPYARSASHAYVPNDEELAGLDDLDEYGSWDDVPGYGHCWRPRVSSGWAPYRDGYWANDYPLGLTWVSNEHWGWAPYHYGRWAYASDNWYWVPGDVVRRPVYSPALVAFVQLPQEERVGWVPLGPGDPYVPRYYDANYQARYFESTTYVNKYVNITKVVNYEVPGAVTVVPVSQFSRVITPRTAIAVDAAVLTRTRPVVDPFLVPTIRQVAPRIEATRAPIAVPADVQQRFARPVLASQAPVVPPVTANVASAMKVQTIPAGEAKRKLQVNNSGQTVAVSRPNGLPMAPVTRPQPTVGQNGQPANQNSQAAAASEERKARIAALAPQAAQGNKVAKREMRQLEQQQQVQDKLDRKAAAQQQVAQQAQEAEQRKAEKKAARQQAQQAATQQQAQQAQQAEQQRAQKKAERQQAQQAAAQQQAQQAQQAEQQRTQKKAERQQAQQAAAQQQAQQAEQQRAQKKAERQQAQQAAAQQAEQQRAQKEAARKQAQQAAQQQQAQQAEQRRAQKKAERQQAQQAAAQQQAQQAQQAEQQRAQKKAERQQAQQAAAQQAEQQRAQKEAARKQAQQAAQQQQAQQAEQQRAQKKAERQQQAQQAAAQQQAQQEAARKQAQAAEQQRAQQESQRKAQREAARQQAQQQQQAAQQQQQQEQRRAQKQAERQQAQQQAEAQAQQKRQQEKAQRKAERQQQQQPQQAPPSKNEKKNKNKNTGDQQ